MDKNPADEIEIAALLKRFAERRYPRTLDLKKKVFAGEKLNESELAFLETVIRDARYILPYTDKHPEYQGIASKAIQMYNEIIEQALENEKTPGNKKQP